MGFNKFDDGDTEGTNVNIVDPEIPSRKIKVTERRELPVTDSVTEISAPIHNAVGNTATRIDSPQLAGRKSVTIQVDKNIYVGFNNSITTSAGYYLFLRKGQIVELSLSDNIELWAISTSASSSTEDVVLTQGRQ